MFDASYILTFLPKLLESLPVTLGLVGVATAAGLLLGLLFALARLEKLPVLAEASTVLISFLRGTPVLVQMFVVYYGLPLLLQGIGIDILRWDKIIFIYITYALNASAYFSEGIRAAVLAVPARQWDAAAACGLTKGQSYRRVILPQALPIAIPSLGMTFTGLLQDSSLAFSLGILDVMGRAKTLGALTSRALEAYAAAAVIFIILTLLSNAGFHTAGRSRKRKEALT
ncbi:MAG: ABC transporter permease subunit [Oscillospiraceae bacterium]|jgi:L-cystine transport system permease protein|nr:ABC transporter permease subunit [Oscillospiraceae bacterium]